MDVFNKWDAETILIRNLSRKEKYEYESITESNVGKQNMNNAMIDILFNSIASLGPSDFGDIPSSKGDITKYKHYSHMKKTLKILREQSEYIKNKNMYDHEFNIINDAISNISSRKRIFEDGFKLNKKFTILTYNVLVTCCIYGISHLVMLKIDNTSFMDNFFKSSLSDDKHMITYLNIKATRNDVNIAVYDLEKFNKCCKTKDFDKAMNTITYYDKNGNREFDKPTKEQFDDDYASQTPLTEEAVSGLLGIGFVVGAVLLVLPIIRELIFFFYYTRMKISEYIEQQIAYLELNEITIKKNSTLGVDKKKCIIDSQNKWIEKLRNVSEKIKVDTVNAERQSKQELEKENKSIMTMNNVKNNMRSKDDEINFF